MAKIGKTVSILSIFLAINSIAQVAHELNVDKKVTQSHEDKDFLQKEYKRLSSNPQLFKRGTSHVYKGEYRQAIQFPVGGIGTGCIQFDGNGSARYWQIFNNMTHDFVPNSFFALKVKNGDKSITKAIQTTDVSGLNGMNSVEITGEFPFIDYHFSDSELPLKVSKRVFNPFIPTDLKNSSIPAVFYEFTIENSGDRKVAVDLTGLQQNAVGFTQVKKIPEGNSFAERFQKSIARKLVDGNKSSFYGGNINKVKVFGETKCLYMTSDRKADDEHFGEMALIAFDKNASVTTNCADISSFLTSDKKSFSNSDAKSADRVTWTGLINSNFTLNPGEKKTVRFALLWNFPNGFNGGHMKSWDAWGKGKWQGVGNYYANHWKNIDEMCHYVVKNHRRFTAQTQLFHDTFYQTNLPHWLLDRLSSQLAILQSRTIFHDKSGYFGLWEGVGAGDGSCAGNCNHVWHYAQAHARLFPDMARKIKDQSYKHMKPNGQIPYRQPAGSYAFDGQCGDILGTYREYLLSEDAKWLKSHYPSVKKALNFVINHNDADKDGWLTGKMHTTYDCSLSGNSSFLSSLYLATLKVGAKMAEICNDSEQANAWQEIAQKSATRQTKELWNGEYFIQIADKNGRASDYDDGCFSDQLLGQWWFSMLGGNNLYQTKKIDSAVKSILKYNFKSSLKFHKQTPRQFALPNEAALLTSTWPKGKRPKSAPGYSDEIWSGFEYTVAAQLIEQNQIKGALTMLRAGYDRYDGKLRTDYDIGNGWGNFGFSGNPFGDDECGQFYSRSLAHWSVLQALQGFHYNGPEKSIKFAPKWNPKNHKSFFNSAAGWGIFSQKIDQNQMRTELSLKLGRTSLKTIELSVPFKVEKISLESAKFSQKGDKFTIILDKAAELKAGDTLKITLN